jgi:CDP-glycerol glycerophosphotransferase (TagB/SpsB family)
MMATFHKNGQFILNLASLYPETTWAIRPHPCFDQFVTHDNVLSKEELDYYYEEWEKYGVIFKEGDYFELFQTSDCLITDCISFLADYFPTGKPVFHLRSDAQAIDFNDLGKSIIKTYYQIHNNAELERLFFRVIIQGDDFMKEERVRQIENLKLIQSETASRRVFEHLKKELQIQ